MNQSDKHSSTTRRKFLPDGMTKLDWTNLAADPVAAFSWIKSLLLKEQDVTVYLDGTGEKNELLWHLFVEHRLRQRKEARPVLYFCFPYFVELNEENQIAESLLRWPCQLIPPSFNEARWQLKVAPPNTPEWNDKWANWAEQYTPAAWSDQLKTLASSDDLLQAFSQFVIKMMEETEWTSNSVYPALRSFPDIDIMNAEFTKGQLSWFATLGIDNQVFSDTGHSTDLWLQPIKEEDGTLGLHYLTKSDPFQYSALRMAARYQHLMVVGKSGSGKSSLAREAVKTALLEGKKCLWVSRDSAGLTSAQQKFDQQNHPLSGFFLRDLGTDWALLQKQLETYAKKPLGIGTQDISKWEISLAKLKRQQIQLEESYQSGRQVIFGEQSRAAIMGHYLASSRRENKALLSSQLSAAQFVFEPKEYQATMSAIQTTHPIFKKHGAPGDALKNLNSAIFIHQSEEESRTFIQSNTENFLTRAETLHQKFLRKQSQYADQYHDLLLENYQMLRVQHQHLSDMLEDGLNDMGADVFRSGDRTLKFYSSFSGKFRNAIKQREHLNTSWTDMIALHENYQLFEFEWGEEKVLRQPVVLSETLRLYSEKLEDWRKGLNEKITDESIRLNYKTAHTDLPVSREIEQLELDFEQFIDDVNAAGLYQLPLRSKMLTLPKQQRHLEEIMQKISQTQAGLERFTNYYRWQRNWFTLSETSRKVLTALMKSRAENWDAAFTSWYFSECLSMHFKPSSTVNEEALGEYKDKFSALQQQAGHIRNLIWLKKKQDAASNWRSIARAQAPSHAGELFERHGQALTGFYPLWFTTPRHAAEIAASFDLVIIDDAQSLSTAEVELILDQASHSLVMYDEDQGRGLADAKAGLSKKNMPVIRLGEHYLPSFAAKLAEPQTQVQFIQVDGRYDESLGRNTAEAEEVLKVLNAVQQTPQRTYPRVGVVTMTKAQRNYIWELFHDIKKRKLPGFEAIQQLERNGLEVLSINDLGGQEFDQLVCCGTYGIVNIDNEVGDQMNVLNLPESKAALNILQHKMPSSIVVINSMPLQEFEARLTWSERSGEQLFSGIMLSLFAASIDQTSEFFRIEKVLQKEEHLAAHENDSLARELGYRLQKQLPNWKWKWGKLEFENTPVLQLRSPTGNKFIVPFDGFIAQTAYTNFAWEAEVLFRARAIGYQIMPLSIDQLSRDPAKTCLRLAQKLKSMDVLEEE